MVAKNLNRKLAEWRWGKGYSWYPPEDPYRTDEPDFIHDLNLFFIYLAPKAEMDFGKDFWTLPATGDVALQLCKSLEIIIDRSE